MSEQNQKNKQNKDMVQNLSDIGKSLSDFEEVKNQDKNYTIIRIDDFGYIEKMKSKKNNGYYMIKKIFKKFVDLVDFKRENKIHSQLSHENIIKLYGYFEDKEKEAKINEMKKFEKEKVVGDTEIYCQVFECVENGNLGDYLSKHKAKYIGKEYIPIEQDFIIKILTQALSALNYLQSQSVIHRNLTLENILLDENNNIKISEFGLSALKKDNNPINKNKDDDLFMSERVGRIDFVCPEIEKAMNYGFKADIYSLGLGMLCLMSKENPINIIKIGEKRQRTIDIKNMDESYCKDLRNLVKHMINPDSEKRINSQKAYYNVLQINNSRIIHSPDFNPIKYLDDKGIQLSDFEEIKNGQKDFYFLGSGSYGYTEKMKSKKDNKIYAIKKLIANMNLRDKKYFRRETEIMINLNHENIIKFYGYFKDKEKKDKFKEIQKIRKEKINTKINLDDIKEDQEMFCLVMEYAENGSLESYYEDYKKKFTDKEHFIPLDEKIIIKILKQILNGMIYFHNKGVIHRDIKPDNILLDKNYNIKISDFGISGLFKIDNKDEGNKNDDILFYKCSHIGRKDFLCPEIKNNDIYGYNIDIYNLGLTMLCIMSYENPIDYYNNYDVNRNAIHESYNTDLKNLVLRMLNENKLLRPTEKEIFDELEKIELIKNSQKLKENDESKNVNNLNNINNPDYFNDEEEMDRIEYIGNNQFINNQIKNVNNLNNINNPDYYKEVDERNKQKLKENDESKNVQTKNINNLNNIKNPDYYKYDVGCFEYINIFNIKENLKNEVNKNQKSEFGPKQLFFGNDDYYISSLNDYQYI